MADFPPHWVPLSSAFYAEDFYYENITPKLRPSPEQILPRHGSDELFQSGMFDGFYRPQMGSFPAYPFGLRNPVQPQGETVMETRARVLLRQQAEFMRNRMLEIQKTSKQKVVIQSVSDKDKANNNGESLQEKFGGTGVFLPVPRQIALAPKHQQGEKRKKKNKAKEVEEENKEESNYELPPDICLPPEWIY